MTQTQKHTVFIVDDDPDDRESIYDAFIANKHNHHYTFMNDGDQLIDHFSSVDAQKHPSLILLDLNMPGRNGRDILKEMKTNETLKPIPIIVLTTSSSEKDRAISYALGANCFLTKPDSYQDLMEITDSIAKLWL